MTEEAAEPQRCSQPKTGVFFNFSEWWDCEQTAERQLSSTNVTTYAPSLINILAVMCTNITCKVCPKAFFVWSFSVVADQTTYQKLSFALHFYEKWEESGKWRAPASFINFLKDKWWKKLIIWMVESSMQSTTNFIRTKGCFSLWWNTCRFRFNQHASLSNENGQMLFG